MSSYSPDLRIELISTGDQAGTWGNTTNTNLGTIIESAIAGYSTVSVISAAQAFTVVNGAADQARLAMIRLTTTTAANFSVYAPPGVSKQYIIWNNSGYTATIYNSTTVGGTTAAGNGITIANGEKLAVFTDGTDFYGVDVSGVAGTAHGGTGLTTYTANGVLYASSASALANGSNFVFDGTNVGIGASTPATYGKFVVGGTGSFISSLVSTSTTLTDKPTFEFRKTEDTPSVGTTNNQIGRISFYSQQGSTTTESAYINARDYRIGNISLPELKLATYSSTVSGETNYITLGPSGMALLTNSNDGITFTGNKYIFDAGADKFYVDPDAEFAGAVDVAGALTVATVPVVTTTGSQTLTNKTLGSGLTMAASAISSGTVKATTSGASHDFTSIPSWVKRITVMFQGVSTAGTGGTVSPPMLQIGSSGIVATTGYSGTCTVTGTGSATQNAGTSGFLLNPATTYTSITYAYSGSVTLCLLNSSTNTWVISGVLSVLQAPYSVMLAGFKSLAGALNILRLTTENGTDTFDAGSINILYE